MSARNLTSRSPHLEANANAQPNNSNLSDAGSEFSDLANPFNDKYNNGSMSSFEPAEPRQRMLNYSSSLGNSSTGSVTNPFESANNVPLARSGTETPQPPSFPKGAYPQGLAGSTVDTASSASYSTNSTSDSTSQVPPDADTDYSPFGGYPASSFPLLIDEKEDDDYLHNPDPIADAEYENNRFWYDLKSMDRRSICGLIGLICFAVGLLSVMVVMPVLIYAGLTGRPKYVPETHQMLSEYTYPKLAAIRTSLVDPDTPREAHSRKAQDGSNWRLVFSDEFAAEGRTFYEGDDQFFYAPDFHYQSTTDLEWYDPDAVTTANGTLNLRMDAFQNHNLFYRSGMLHSWNHLCFTQGILEVSALLPHMGNVTGLWPGLWSMGNLGRPGFMATTDGVWPYSYEECDAGITPNQSSADGISYLPGQRLNSCTCKGGDHPNRGTGRGAPEIDILEAEVDTTVKNGLASQSIQVAPFDPWYMPDYNWFQIHNNSVTTMNNYAGGPYQEAVSAVSMLNNNWYERSEQHQFQKYAFEYLNDNSNGYVTWYVGDNPTWTAHANALAPNGNVGWRRISKEPMSIVVNLGISNSWAYIDWPMITFPVQMRLDSIRIYQPSDQVSLTCDPVDHPTYDFIQAHPKAYQNWNNTKWGHGGAGYEWPKHKLNGGC